MLKSHIAIHKTEDDEEEEDVEEVVEVKHKTVISESDKRYLKKSEVCIRLSFLGKTADGDGYTYLKAALTGMGLTHIDAIKSFKHLQFLDVSENKLEHNELQVVAKLPYLILLQADKNNLNSAALPRMPYLQVLIMNNNDISTVHDVYQPELSTLEVGFNKVQRIYFTKTMANIKCLDFRNNLITDIVDLNFPMLDSLYLANNHIVSLVGLHNLVNLRILHVRNNPIRVLDGFHESQTKLNYVNLRNCKVSSLKQVKKLRVLKQIDTLILKGTPLMGGSGEEGGAGGEEDDTEIRMEILAALPRLKKLNKASVTPEERQEAHTLMLQWIEDGDKEEDEIEEEIHEEAGET